MRDRISNTFNCVISNSQEPIHTINDIRGPYGFKVLYDHLNRYSKCECCVIIHCDSDRIRINRAICLHHRSYEIYTVHLILLPCVHGVEYRRISNNECERTCDEPIYRTRDCKGLGGFVKVGNSGIIHRPLSFLSNQRIGQDLQGLHTMTRLVFPSTCRICKRIILLSWMTTNERIQSMIYSKL